MLRSTVTTRITTFITSAGCSIAKRSASGASSSGNSWLTSGASRSRVALDERRPPRRTRRCRSTRRRATSSSFSVKLPSRSVTSSPDMPTCTTRPADATSSTAARTAAGTPVASITTSGPRRRPLAAPCDDLVRASSRAASPRRARVRARARPRAGRRRQHRRAPVLRGQEQRLADRARAEHDHALAFRDRGRGARRAPRSTPARRAPRPQGSRRRSGTPAPPRCGAAPAGRRPRGSRSG